MYKILRKKKIDKYKEQLKELNPHIKITDTDTVFIVLSKEKKLLGYAILSSDNILKDICIEKNYRYSSYGIKLIEFIKNYFSDQGIDEIYLDNFEKNTVFFKKIGFQKNKENRYVIKNLTAPRKRKKDGIYSTILSIIINIILAIIKIFFGITGKSKALVADGFHSVSDIIGSLIVLVGVYLGYKPADENHPYGHGKIESIAGNIIGVLLVITAYTLILDNITDYFHETVRIIPEKFTLIISIISIVTKYLLYRYKLSVGNKIKSDAVLADAREHKSDVLSSIGVLVGILLSIYVNPIFDLILSIIVGLIIGKEGLHIIFQTSNNLMDVQDQELIKDIKEYVDSFDFVDNTHDIRMKTSGNMIYLSLHIRLDGNMTIYEGHELSDDIKYSLLSHFDNIKDVTIHIDCSI